MYDALRAGQQTPQLPPLPIQYIDFAAWQRSRLEGELDVQARSSVQADVLDLICRIICPCWQRRKRAALDNQDAQKVSVESKPLRVVTRWCSGHTGASNLPMRRRCLS